MEHILVFGTGALCAGLAARLRDRAVVLHACESQDASEQLCAKRWAAVILESGEDALFAAVALRALQTAAPTVPALVILGEESTTFVNLLRCHHAELFIKPARMSQVLDFVERALAGARRLRNNDVNARGSELVVGRQLTWREAELLAIVLERESREQVIQRWRVPPLVVDAEFLSLLRKCGSFAEGAQCATLKRA